MSHHSFRTRGFLHFCGTVGTTPPRSGETKQVRMTLETEKCIERATQIAIDHCVLQKQRTELTYLSEMAKLP
jgi:hypothetical protein